MKDTADSGAFLAVVIAVSLAWGICIKDMIDKKQSPEKKHRREMVKYNKAYIKKHKVAPFR